MFGRRDKPAQIGRFTNRTPLMYAVADDGKNYCRFCGGKIRKNALSASNCGNPECLRLELSANGAANDSDGRAGQRRRGAKAGTGPGTKTAPKTGAKTGAKSRTAGRRR